MLNNSDVPDIKSIYEELEHGNYSNEDEVFFKFTINKKDDPERGGTVEIGYNHENEEDLTLVSKILADINKKDFVYFLLEILKDSHAQKGAMENFDFLYQNFKLLNKKNNLSEDRVCVKPSEILD